MRQLGFPRIALIVFTEITSLPCFCCQYTRLFFEEVTKTKFNLGIDRATILRAIDRVVQ